MIFALVVGVLAACGVTGMLLAMSGSKLGSHEDELRAVTARRSGP